MAKIQDKFFNRVIEGDLLELSDADKERAGLGGETKLYNHIVVVGRTDDVEDDPWLCFMFQSLKPSYNKSEFESFVKNVASFSTIDAVNFGIPCFASNGDYSTSKEGLYRLYWNENNSRFYGKQTENGSSNVSINFGATFAYFDIVSKEI